MMDNNFKQIAQEIGVPESEIAGIYFDEEKSERLIFTRNQLTNQLQKNIPKITSSFDDIYSNELRELSSEISEILPILYLSQREALENNDKVLSTCGDLLRNASQTLMASIHCLRSGFTFQSGILLRSVVEMCTSAFYLYTVPNDLENFIKGEIKSTNSLSLATKKLPIYGKIWGLLSNNHIHVNTLHTEFYPMTPFTDKNEVPTEVTISIIGTVLMVLRVTTELINHDNVDNLKYWKKNSSTELQFIPPEEDRMQWILEKLDKIKHKDTKF